jgi:hypothetical protein
MSSGNSHVQLLSDIIGPGIIIGYVALCIATICIGVKPAAFEGTANGMASVTMAIGYSISSIIQTSRTKKGLETDDDLIYPQTLAFATSMTSIALAFASVSMLSRGKIATLIDPKNDYRHHRSNLAIITYRKVPASYMIFFLVVEVASVALGIYTARQLETCSSSGCLNARQLDGKHHFTTINTVLLCIQASFVVYTVVASMFTTLTRHRWVTIGVAVVVPIMPSIAFMIWAHGTSQVGVNFGDWSYGQTFNATAGCAGFATTFVSWLASKDSATDD